MQIDSYGLYETMDCFKYLKPRASETAVFDKYSFTDLQELILISKEPENKFFVGPYDVFRDWYMGLKNRRCHEVILRTPQRIKFDLDFPENVTESANMLIDEILTTSIEIFRDEYGIRVSYEDFAICNSNGENKRSYHIICRYMVENNDIAREFTNEVIERCAMPSIRRIIDCGINSQIHSLRLVLSVKDGRKKVIDNEGDINDILLDTLVQPPVSGCIVLRGPKTLKTRTPIIINNDLPSESIKIILSKIPQQYLIGMSYSHSIGNLLTFIRTSPSYCHICGHIHTNENSLLCLARDGGIWVNCRRSMATNNDNEWVFLGNFGNLPQSDNTYKQLLMKFINDIIHQRIGVEDFITGELERDYPNNAYHEPYMMQYPLTRTLFVKANMGVGKTKALEEHISTHFIDQRIVFITFRQSFSKAISHMFPDFVLYNKIKGNICVDKIIIQLESLHRLWIQEGGFNKYDLIVLDESESVISQFSSGLHGGNLQRNFAVFKLILETANYVICMDANLGDRTYRILRELRGDEGIMVQRNTFAYNDTFHEFTSRQDIWLYKVIDAINNNKRIVIAANSKKLILGMSKLIRSEFPSLVTRSYTGDSGDKRDFEDVNKAWKHIDVLLYSPTLTAGISFEKQRFDKLFGYFVNISCDVEACRQMIQRVRILRDKEMFHCISHKFIKLPISRQGIINHLNNSALLRDRGYQQIMHAIPVDYDWDGQIVPQDTCFTKVAIENLLCRNLSISRFTQRFVGQIAATYCPISFCSDKIDPEILTLMRDKLKHYKVLAMEELAEEIAESEIIDAEMFEELRDSTEYISCEEEKSLKRFNLASIYRFPIEKITGEWVFKYNEPAIIYAFTNLRHISIGSNSTEAIANMSKYDINDYYNETRSNKHKLVRLLIRKLGFKFKILEDSSIIMGNFVKNINTLMIMRGYKKYL